MGNTHILHFVEFFMMSLTFQEIQIIWSYEHFKVIGLYQQKIKELAKSELKLPAWTTTTFTSLIQKFRDYDWPASSVS